MANAEPQGVSFSYVDQNTPVISKELTFSNERQKVSITTRKLDKETEVPVAGAVFGLYTDEDIMLGDKTLVEKNTLLQEMESGKDGNAVFTPGCSSWKILCEGNQSAGRILQLG